MRWGERESTCPVLGDDLGRQGEAGGRGEEGGEGGEYLAYFWLVITTWGDRFKV